VVLEGINSQFTMLDTRDGGGASASISDHDAGFPLEPAPAQAGRE